MANVTLTANAGSYLTTGSDVIFSIISVEVPVEPPSGGYAGGVGVRRIRKFAPRKRKREDEEEPVEVVGSTPVQPPPSKPPSPPALPPQPGLMAGIPPPPLTVLHSPKVENDDDEAIALLLETLFS